MSQNIPCASERKFCKADRKERKTNMEVINKIILKASSWWLMWLGHPDTRNIRIPFSCYNCGFICSSALFNVLEIFHRGNFWFNSPYSHRIQYKCYLFSWCSFSSCDLSVCKKISWTDWTDRNYCLQTAPHLFHTFFLNSVWKKIILPTIFTLLAASK